MIMSEETKLDDKKTFLLLEIGKVLHFALKLSLYRKKNRHLMKKKVIF